MNTISQRFALLLLAMVGLVPVMMQAATESTGVLSMEERPQEQRIAVELERFGAAFFRNPPSTFAPVTDVPIPADYVIGTGDTVVVTRYGRSDQEHRLAVSRDGEISIPGLAPLSVAGLTFAELKPMVQKRIARAFVGEEAAVTLGDLRSIRVFVMGDVVSPGSFTIGGFSTMTNALLASGGIRESGSMRNVELRRAGARVAELDLYQLLLKGRTHGDRSLQPGDVIFVPPVGPTVSVEGEVNRPARYELRNEKTIAEVLAMAGGLRAEASRRDVHLERLVEDGSRRVLDLDLSVDAGWQTAVIAGDALRIFGGSDALGDVVSLIGQVRRPGVYGWKAGMQLADLIGEPKDLVAKAATEYVVIRREVGAERLTQVQSADLRKILDPSTAHRGLALERRDEVLVFERSEDRAKRLEPLLQELRGQAGLDRPAPIVEVRGNVRFPGFYPWELEQTACDLLRAAGGGLEGTDTEYAVVAEESHPRGIVSARSTSLMNGCGGPLAPSATVLVFHRREARRGLLESTIASLREQTGFGELSPVVAIRGPVRAPGFYPFEEGMSAADLVRAAGGRAERAYGGRAQLSRSHIRETGIEVEHLDLDLQGADADPGLRPYDQLVILEQTDEPRSSSARISGEVLHPGTYPIGPDDTIRDLVERAGGLTEQAYAFGARFERESLRREEQRSVNEVYDGKDDLLADLTLSPSVGNEDKWYEVPPSHRTFGAIRNVETPTTKGRMVIDLDDLLSGGHGIDLEPGDHLHVPRNPMSVSVVGQVYRSTSHRWEGRLGATDYIDRSGGHTVLANEGHAFVRHANGEVVSLRSGWWRFHRPRNLRLRPGATIFVPLHVDRANELEVFSTVTNSISGMAKAAKP